METRLWIGHVIFEVCTVKWWHTMFTLKFSLAKKRELWKLIDDNDVRFKRLFYFYPTFLLLSLRCVNSPVNFLFSQKKIRLRKQNLYDWRTQYVLDALSKVQHLFLIFWKQQLSEAAVKLSNYISITWFSTHLPRRWGWHNGTHSVEMPNNALRSFCFCAYILLSNSLLEFSPHWDLRQQKWKFQFFLEKKNTKRFFRIGKWGSQSSFLPILMGMG